MTGELIVLGGEVDSQLAELRVDDDLMTCKRRLSQPKPVICISTCNDT